MNTQVPVKRLPKKIAPRTVYNTNGRQEVPRSQKLAWCTYNYRWDDDALAHYDAIMS